MARSDWVIVVVDPLAKRWPPAWTLRQVGLSPRLCVRYAQIRRQLSPAGLRRKAAATRN